MAKLMNIPVLRTGREHEAMSCPDCGRQIKGVRRGHIGKTARELGVPVLGRIPMEEKTAAR